MLTPSRIIQPDKPPEGYVRLASQKLPFYSPGNSEQLTQLSVQVNAAPQRDSLPQAFSSTIYTRQLYPDTPYFTRTMPPVTLQVPISLASKTAVAVVKTTTAK